MQTESESLELIIILALVAVFILFQLRRTLGKKTGFDPSRDQPEAQKKQGEEDAEGNVFQIRPDAEQIAPVVNLGLNKSSPFYDIIEKINQCDHSFTLQSFFDGAEYAYGFILSAFWNGDKKNLRSMLSRQVFDQFDGVLKDAEQRNVHSDNKLMDIEKIDLVEASLSGSLAEITVEFTSHMIMVTRGGDDKIIEGNPDKTVQISDIWTFCRDVKSRDPNWTLVATRTS